MPSSFDRSCYVPERGFGDVSLIYQGYGPPRWIGIVAGRVPEVHRLRKFLEPDISVGVRTIERVGAVNYHFVSRCASRSVILGFMPY